MNRRKEAMATSDTIAAPATQHGAFKALVLPGFGGSGPRHWQTLWEQADSSFTRVNQHDWHRPVCSDWIASLERAVAHAGPDTVLVAHSMACLLVAHWAAVSTRPVRGALLVAAPDPDGPVFPQDATGFSPFPRGRFPFRSIVVASTNDPFGSVAFNNRCASDWGSSFLTIGDAGHINADSDLGNWPQGLDLLKTLIRDDI
jgi:predicted alpha/beta hydrolase family esterase